MKRTLSCRLDGPDVVQTTTVLNDDGTLHSENISRLGEQSTVLDHLEAEVVGAKRDRDGCASPKTGKPAAPGDGVPGVEIVFWLDGRNVYRNEIQRNAKGKVTSQRTEPLGRWTDKLANLEERLAELTDMRDKVRDAK